MHPNDWLRNAWLRWSVVLAVLLGVPVAGADTRTSVSGFGSVGAGRVLTSGGEFADYDNEWRADTDSVVGVQLDIAGAQGVTFTAQGVARGYDYGDAGAHYDPSLELLFLAYQASDNLRLRSGLIRTPFFIYSESVEVGYAYPWVRPPIDVYGPIVMSVTHIKGADASLFLPMGEALLEWRLLYGNYDTRLQTTAVDYDLHLEPLVGSTVSVSWNEWLFRYSHYRLTASIDSDGLNFVQQYYQTLGAVDPVFAQLAHDVGGRNQVTVYQVFGMQYEAAGWLLTSEIDYESARKKQFSVSIGGAYLSIARQIDKFTPYVVTSYAKSRPGRHLYADLQRSEDIILSGENLLLDIVRQGTLQAFDAVRFTNNRNALGVRYDVNENVDLKAELEFSSIERESNPAQLPDHQKMLTIVMDWVL